MGVGVERVTWPWMVSFGLKTLSCGLARCKANIGSGGEDFLFELKKPMARGVCLKTGYLLDRA